MKKKQQVHQIWKCLVRQIRMILNGILEKRKLQNKVFVWLKHQPLLRWMPRSYWPSPKSGDTTRCVNVVDNHGFPPVRLDNQQRFVDKTMIWQCETFKNVKFAVVLTFIVSFGTNLFTNKLWWKHAGHESIRLLKKLIRKASLVATRCVNVISLLFLPCSSYLNWRVLLFLSWFFFRNLADPNPLIRWCWSARLRTTI